MLTPIQKLQSILDVMLRLNSLDSNCRDFLNRLRTEQNAANSLYKISDDDRMVERIILDCMKANDLKLTFNIRISAEEGRQKKLMRYADCVKELLTFLKECQRPTNENDPHSALVIEPPGEIRKAQGSLGQIDRMIKSHMRVAVETAPRIGLKRNSRKTENFDPAETAALGYIASAIEKITKKPNVKHVVSIAQVALTPVSSPITAHRVRNAVEAYKRDWRAPLDKF